MEQDFKSRFYGKGNMRQLRWVAEQGGLLEQEYDLLVAWHFCKTDDDIEAQLHIGKDARIRLEKLTVPKVACALLHAIDYCMEHEPK